MLLSLVFCQGKRILDFERGSEMETLVFDSENGNVSDPFGAIDLCNLIKSSDSGVNYDE
jgi:hypothetical protein